VPLAAPLLLLKGSFDQAAKREGALILVGRLALKAPPVAVYFDSLQDDTTSCRTKPWIDQLVSIQLPQNLNYAAVCRSLV
jgi:hypothetical protein